MADYQYIDATGTVVPDTGTILTTVQDEYKAAFGADLIVTPDTPQGVLITAEALSRTNVVNNNAALANQINPNIAGGVFLDAIMALTGLERIGQTQTFVTATVTGVAGSVIPALSQARTAAGDLFEAIFDIDIAADGNGTGNFQSVDFGPIPCASDELAYIVTPVLGWETVNNPTAGLLGTLQQSDESARATRKNMLAFQGVSLAEAITSALYNVTGVQSLSFRENIEDTTEVIDGITLIPHSVWACVNGGTDDEVGRVLLENKSSGAGWNGDVSVNVSESASGQIYEVKFDRPSVIDILVKVTVALNTSNSNTTDNVIAAVLDYANGNLDGERGFVVGASVSPFELSGAINREFPSIFVKKVEISLTSPVSYSTNEIAIALNEIASTSEGLISVVLA